MVDINLFEEGFEEKSENNREERGSKSSGSGKMEEDDFSGDLSLGDDLSGDVGLGDNSLLEGDETLPDFEDEGEENTQDDYSFQGSGSKKSPPWLLIIVGGIAVLAVLFLYVILPALNAPKPVKPPQTRTPESKPATETTQPSETQTLSGQMQGTAQTLSQGNLDVLVASKAVFENLSAQGQAGVVIINDNQYLVEYVSKTPGVAEAMGQRVQALFGADNFEVSPEEKHATTGESHYWGVVSGGLPSLKTHVFSGTTNPFTSMSAFQERIKALIAQNGLTLQSIEKPAGLTLPQKGQSSGHLIIAGEKQKMSAFINALNQVPGNWGVSKLLLAPMDISDFFAAQVKMGITFWVVTG